MAQENSITGIGWKFPPLFDVHEGTTETVSGEEEILESLQVLMGTLKGERVMKPEFGSDISLRIFDNMTPAAQSAIRRSISQAILMYEPRINLNEVQLDTSSIADGIVNINIDFTVRKTNSRMNIVFPYFMNEGNQIADHLKGGVQMNGGK